MKVLHVFTLATTAESFFDGQFNYLSRRGHEISLICTPDERINDFSRNNFVRYMPMDITRTLAPCQDIKVIIKLFKYIQAEKFDVVVGHTPKGALLSMIAAKLARCKNRVYLRHGLIYTTAVGIKRRLLLLEEKLVSSLATSIINVSPSLGDVAISDNLNKKSKQRVIGKGTCGGIDTLKTFNPDNIDCELMESLRFSLGISKDNYVIGFCGRLCKDKGIIELIDAFNLFREKKSNIKPKLLLVGGYDSRDILPEKTRDKIKYDEDIIHTGHIIKNIQYYYALMDVFVFPSHREGFGMCSIEAQAMGVPVLVSKSHGCIDTIVDGKTGMYIDLSPKNIAEKLWQIYDVKYKSLLGKYARKWVCENFEQTKLWPEIFKFYENLMKTHRIKK